MTDAKPKLYRIAISLETVIAANDPVEAARVARRLLREGHLSEERTDIVASPISSYTQLPSGWDAGCHPFGDDSREIHELLDEPAGGETP